MSMLSTFMESYSQNVQITGGDLSLDEMFRDVTPASYEQVMECVYDLQYSTEAVCTMTEFACNLNESGAAVLTEGLVSSAASAIWEKLKELASKIKGFVVKICKNIAEFINSLYVKASPIDKVMSATNKKVVEWKDIQSAKSDEWKLPGTYKLLGPINVTSLTPDSVVSDIAKTIGVKEISTDAAQKQIDSAVTVLNDLSKEDAQQSIEKREDSYKELSDTFSNFWNGINPYLTEDKLDAIGGKDAFFKKADKGDEDQKFSDADWKLIKTVALEGQSRNKKFQNDVKKSAKKVIDSIDKASKQASRNNKGSENAALVNKALALIVKSATLSANNFVKVVNKLYMPVLRKQHREAIRTFIYVQSSVKSKIRKDEKALK